MAPVTEGDFRVEIYWEPYDTQLYSAKLMRHTQRHETRFSYEANPGSLESAFAVALLANGGYDLIVNQAKYLLKRKRAAEKAGRYAPPAEFSINIDLPNIDIGPIIDMSDNSEERTYNVTIEDDDDVGNVEKVVQALEDNKEQ